ncbi:MAG: hypothetical protein QM811_29105 [Pirellulales bacterium]
MLLALLLFAGSGCGLWGQPDHSYDPRSGKARVPADGTPTDMEGWGGLERPGFKK